MISPAVAENPSISTCWACHSPLCVHFNCPECGPCRKCLELFERIACISPGKLLRSRDCKTGRIEATFNIRSLRFEEAKEENERAVRDWHDSER